MNPIAWDIFPILNKYILLLYLSAIYAYTNGKTVPINEDIPETNPAY